MKPTRNRVAATLLVGLALLTASPAPAVTPTPVPKGHPRVYLRAADLPAIKAKLTDPAFATSWTKVKACSEAVCRAFVYLVQGDTTAGDKAVADALTELKACTDARTFDTCMHHGACVYDWCYALLSSAEQQAYITEFERIAGSHSPGYPAEPGSGGGGGPRHRGLAADGPAPRRGGHLRRAADDVRRRGHALLRPLRRGARLPTTPPHMHHQGDSYFGRAFSTIRPRAGCFAAWAAGTCYPPSSTTCPTSCSTTCGPTGSSCAAGDTYDDQGKSNGKRRLMAMLTGSYYKDPYLLTMADYGAYWSAANIDHVLRLLFRRQRRDQAHRASWR